jgi:predicted anti-sigma-YlaC factor YlaD
MQAYEFDTIALESQPTASCAMVQDLLPLYLEGEVSPASREQITAHLASCTHCAGYLGGAQSVRGQLQRNLITYRPRAAAPITQPIGQLLRRPWSAIIVAALVFLICTVGGVSSMFIAESLRAGSNGMLLFGLVVSAGAYGSLLLLAAGVGPLTPARLLQICASVATGVAAGFVLIYGYGLAQVIALLLAFAAIAMTISAVVGLAPRKRAAPGGP